MSRRVVLIYRALGLGDLLTAVPSLRALKRAFGGHTTTLACPTWLHELVLHSGAVDEVVGARPFDPIAVRSSPDVAVNLHGRGPQSHRVLLATRPRRLVAFEQRDVPESLGSPQWRPREHEVQRWCRLLSESGIPADPSDLHIEPPARAIADLARNATLIHPGAKHPARRWPKDRWAAVAASEARRRRPVVITGGRDEVALATSVARLAGLPESSVLAGRTDVVDLAALVAGAARVTCGDTGVAHLATAVGTPSVVLFGPTSPDEWGPPRARHRALWAGTTGDPHGRAPDAGLLAIQPDDVIGALEELEDVALVATGRGGA